MDLGVPERQLRPEVSSGENLLTCRCPGRVYYCVTSPPSALPSPVPHRQEKPLWGKQLLGREKPVSYFHGVRRAQACQTSPHKGAPAIQKGGGTEVAKPFAKGRAGSIGT